MERQLTHAEIQELLGAYALDAVDEDEAEAVTEHLRDCPRCQAEVTDHRTVAAMLSRGWVRPPDGLWDRIAGSLEEQPPPLRMGQVVPFTPATPGRRLGRWLAAGAGVAAAVVIAVLGVRVANDSERIRRLEAQTSADPLDRAVQAALSDPGAARVDLRSSDGRLSARAVVLADGTGYLFRSNLPRLRSDQTYQLWAVVGGNKISAGVLGPEPERSAFRVAAEVAALAITVEPAGGVVSTERQPAVLGRVSRA